MTAEQIRKIEVHVGTTNILLREIAAQIADANELQKVRNAELIEFGQSPARRIDAPPAPQKEK